MTVPHGGSSSGPPAASVSNAVRAMTRRPDLDLVGVWVHTRREGRAQDAGELAGIDPLGVRATDDARPCWSRSRPTAWSTPQAVRERGAGAVPDYERLLDAGINVVTTTSTELVFPPSADEALRVRLQDAAHVRWRLALRVRASSPGSPPTSSPCCSRRCRGASARAADRDLPERPLPRGRRDDGRARLRPPTSTSSRSSPSPGSSRRYGGARSS